LGQLAAPVSPTSKPHFRHFIVHPSKQKPPGRQNPDPGGSKFDIPSSSHNHPPIIMKARLHFFSQICKENIRKKTGEGKILHADKIGSNRIKI
jgi:hypothetical protein